ncbi:MAG TPA: DnaJ domain-containing protein [Dehalococcoidales bacterium]
MHIKQDLYEILGVVSTADTNDIKEAYRSLAFQYHPDVNPMDPVAKEKMEEINEAYAILSNPVKRRDYDLPRGFSTVAPKFSTGVKVKVNFRSKTPYRDHTGVVDSEPIKDTFRFWYMVRFGSNGVSTVNRFAEEELSEVDKQ